MFDLIRKRKNLTTPETQYFIYQLIDSLCYLHNKQIVHREYYRSYSASSWEIFWSMIRWSWSWLILDWLPSLTSVVNGKSVLYLFISKAFINSNLLNFDLSNIIQPRSTKNSTNKIPNHRMYSDNFEKRKNPIKPKTRLFKQKKVHRLIQTNP